MQIAVTLSPLADVVRQVGGTDFRVLSIVPSGDDPHAFNFSPQDLRVLSGTRAVFRVGHGIDEWLDALAQNAASQTQLYDLSRGIALLPAASLSTQEMHSHSASDPHFWMDLERTAQMVNSIEADLIRQKSSAAQAIKKRAENYRVQLRALDAWTKTQVALIPPSRRKLVTTHNAMRYFASRYGFEIVGATLSGGGETAANARSIAALIKKVRIEKVPAIFVEAGASDAVMKQVATESGARLESGLRIDSLSKTGEASSYIGMYRANVKLIVGALKR